MASRVFITSWAGFLLTECHVTESNTREMILFPDFNLVDHLLYTTAHGYREMAQGVEYGEQLRQQVKSRQELGIEGDRSHRL